MQRTMSWISANKAGRTTAPSCGTALGLVPDWPRQRTSTARIIGLPVTQGEQRNVGLGLPNAVKGTPVAEVEWSYDADPPGQHNSHFISSNGRLWWWAQHELRYLSLIVVTQKGLVPKLSGLFCRKHAVSLHAPLRERGAYIVANEHVEFSPGLRKVPPSIQAPSTLSNHGIEVQLVLFQDTNSKC